MGVCLTDNDVLNLRESGLHRSAVERALLILSAAYPEMSWQQLAALSVGERDARLLGIREHTLGTGLDIFTNCPSCQQELELHLTTTTLRTPVLHEERGAGNEFSTVIGDLMVQYRLPDSSDMQAVAACTDIDDARNLMLQRCILDIQNSREQRALEKSVHTFSPEFVTALAGQIAEKDPQAEILLNLRCAQCQHEWQSLFDIAAFFWSELETHAKRLLNEIYLLARAYHWSERDILALSPLRRRWYLEMVMT